MKTLSKAVKHKEISKKTEPIEKEIMLMEKFIELATAPGYVIIVNAKPKTEKDLYSEHVVFENKHLVLKEIEEKINKLELEREIIYSS